MILKTADICDIGSTRKINQDAVFSKQQGEYALLMVADGMGGHANGEAASGLLKREILTFWELLMKGELRGGFSQLLYFLQQRIQIANRELYEKYNQNEICGTTMVCLFCAGKDYAVLSIGDSRIYYRHGFTFKQLTVDDVWENQPEVRNQYNSGQIRNASQYGKLVAAIGVKAEAAIRVKTDRLKKHDLFLLCSDGVYKQCKDTFLKKQMKAFKKTADTKKWMMDIKEKIYAFGAKDNFSAVFVYVMK